MTGFETLTRTGVTLAVGQEANLTLGLKVGSVNEQVTVTAEAPVVNTSSSSVSGVVEQQRIEEVRIAEERDEVGKRETPRLVGEAIDRKPGQREQDQCGQQQCAQPQHRRRPVDTGSGAPGVGGGGHVMREFCAVPHGGKARARAGF